MAGGEMVLWLNGEYLPLAQARVSPLDRGLLFGDGLFTTLRAQEGRPLHLERHLARLRASAQALRLPADLGQGLGLDPAGPAWPEIIAGLLARNGLDQGLARVKLILTRGPAPGLGLPPAERPTLLALAEPYSPPSAAEYAAGWRLHILSEGHAPPLAGHKTLNYLYFMLARQEALEAGCQEAVILGPQGEVCETAMGSLLAHDGQGWWTPTSPWQLPGVTLELACAWLERQGQAVARRQARPDELIKAETVWVLGSLMGVMPAAAVAGQALPRRRTELAEELRQEMFLGNSAVSHA